jgi:hypothetical protein
MKKINKISLLLLLLPFLAACNSWLEKEPLTQFTDDNYWTSESSVKMFCNGFYSLFNGFGTGAAGTLNSNGGSGTESDFYFASFTDDQANRGIEVFPTAATATASTWSTPYNYIRLTNLLLERVDRVASMTDAQKDHYRGIAYFFRAMEYYDLIRHYGDVPYVDKYLDQAADASVIWGEKVSRNTVMDNVLSDLNNAVAMLYPKSIADANSVNQDVANALKSRICLYEGTFSKYQLQDNARAEKYLNECKTASQAVRTNTGSGYMLNPDYRTVYSSMDLSKDKETLLCRIYIAGTTTHSVVGYCNSSTLVSGLTKDAVDAFLCTDGQPIGLSSLYQGDDCDPATLSIAETTLKNRDQRLVESVSPILCYTGKPNASGWMSTTGYLITRFNNASMSASELLAPYNTTDAPIFWLPEILLNEAEALVELNAFDQTAANNTVNQLRSRAGVDPLLVANVPVDPKKDSDVSALLWEVRRERRVELMMTSFRYWDLRRWAKISYLNPTAKPDIFKGAKVPAGTSETQGGQDVEGYILPYSSSTAATRVITVPQHYLDFIPTGQVQLYANKGIQFPQNTGW